jgi:hypothetical protein
MDRLCVIVAGEEVDKIKGIEGTYLTVGEPCGTLLICG